MKHTFQNINRRTNSFTESNNLTHEITKIVRHQTREDETRPMTQLVCPSCLNKSVSNDEGNRSLKSKTVMKTKEDTSIKDFNKQANEDLIKVRIANREQKTHDASQSLTIFRDAEKLKLQKLNESQNQSEFFRSIDHRRERAKMKNNQLEKLIRNHVDKFTPKGKMEMMKEERYANQSTSLPLKSMSCPPSIKDNYSNDLQSQIDQRNKRLLDAKTNEKSNDRLALECSMNQTGKQLKCKRAINKDMEMQCAEQNDRIIVMKHRKMNELKEMNNKMDQEYFDNNRKQMSEHNREKMNKRNQLNGILNYNMNMDTNKHIKMDAEKKNDLQYKNKGYLRELLCQHGCKVYQCSICLRIYPRRVLTPLVSKSKK